ncbi:MAG: response regulator transcription factor [Maricaulaceae bacterium]
MAGPRKSLLRWAGYGLALALGAFALQWLDYRVSARAYALELGLGLAGAGFLALGVWVGRQLYRRPGLRDLNRATADALGLTEREMAVLALLAQGLTNKAIARRLAVSPNTVKTHARGVFRKLGAANRTQAVAAAQAHRLIG